MTTPEDQHDGAIGGLARHSIYEGLVALLVAILHLILLRGVSFGLLLVFVAPPLMAFMILRRSVDKGARRIALAFLLLVAIGAIIAPFPAVLPNLGGFDRRLPAKSDRLLSWYTFMHLAFALGILPAWYFIVNLCRHWRGEPAKASRFTCYLGLLAGTVFWPMLAVLLGALLGLWPFPRVGV